MPCTIIRTTRSFVPIQVIGKSPCFRAVVTTWSDLWSRHWPPAWNINTRAQATYSVQVHHCLVVSCKRECINLQSVVTYITRASSAWQLRAEAGGGIGLALGSGLMGSAVGAAKVARVEAHPFASPSDI